MGHLDGRVALVTGAGSGIGRAIATAFAAEGATVHVTDVDSAGGAETVREIGSAAVFHHLDVREPAAADRVRDTIGTPVDVLVNNAGVGHVGTALTTELEDLDRIYAVNVRGVLAVTRAFLPAMVERGRGSIVNMASIGGVVGVRDRLAYCASKFAVVGITKTMALDHATQGVRVNCICPGRVETPFVKARLAEYPDPDAAYREMSATQAMGRMASPDEIAQAAVFLASDMSSFVTGETLMVDGGWSAGK